MREDVNHCTHLSCVFPSPVQHSLHPFVITSPRVLLHHQGLDLQKRGFQGPPNLRLSSLQSSLSSIITSSSVFPDASTHSGCLVFISIRLIVHDF